MTPEPYDIIMDDGATKLKALNDLIKERKSEERDELIDLIEDALRWFPSGVWNSRDYIDRTDIKKWLKSREVKND